eukprot:7378008-Lingulodinium_polyedra.AAC.1
MEVTEEVGPARYQVTELQVALRDSDVREHANAMATERRANQLRARKRWCASRRRKLRAASCDWRSTKCSAAAPLRGLGAKSI